MFTFGNSSQSNMIELENDTIHLCNKALQISEYDFSIIDGFRTVKQQKMLYDRGVTECDGTIEMSAHQSGLAIDVFPYVRDRNGGIMNMWNYDDPKVKLVWYEIHRAFLRAGRLLGLNIELGLTYNIDGGYDYPHIEINK